MSLKRHERADKKLNIERMKALAKRLEGQRENNAPFWDNLSRQLDVIEKRIERAEGLQKRAEARRQSTVKPKATATSEEVQEKLDAEAPEGDVVVDDPALSPDGEVDREGFTKSGEPTIPADAKTVTEGTDWNSGIEDEAAGGDDTGE